MMKNLTMVALLGVSISACAVSRPMMSPHRGDTPEHRQAKTVAQCLACHAGDIPHAKDRGDCLKCHILQVRG